RFVAAEIAIRQTKHQAIANHIEETCRCGRRRLRHYVTGVRDGNRIESRDYEWTASPFRKCRIGRRGEVRVEIKDAQLIAGLAGIFSGLEISERTRRPGGWRNIPVHVRGQHAANTVRAVNARTRREQNCSIKIDKARSWITVQQ